MTIRYARLLPIAASLLLLLSGHPVSAGDYDVDTSQGTYTSGGLAPDPVCVDICENQYHYCAGDCYRGAIEEMAMCLSDCYRNYCRRSCSK